LPEVLALGLCAVCLFPFLQKCVLQARSYLFPLTLEPAVGAQCLGVSARSASEVLLAGGAPVRAEPVRREAAVSGTAGSLVFQIDCAATSDMLQSDDLAKTSLEKSCHVIVRKMEKKTFSLCLFFVFVSVCSFKFSSIGL